MESRTSVRPVRPAGSVRPARPEGLGTEGFGPEGYGPEGYGPGGSVRSAKSVTEASRASTPPRPAAPAPLPEDPGLPEDHEDAHDPRDPEDAELPEMDGRILRMLLSGHTDATVACRLGIGRRTVQRRIRHMMDQAGVSSRIQLGWHAREHFWL